MKEIYTSEEILGCEDLYCLQDTFCSSGIPFIYLMSSGEMGWLDFIRNKYSIADWIDSHSIEGALIFNDMYSMSKALDDDCNGLGKAVMLSDCTALQKLFFWLYDENLEGE